MPLHLFGSSLASVLVIKVSQPTQTKLCAHLTLSAHWYVVYTTATSVIGFSSKNLWKDTPFLSIHYSMGHKVYCIYLCEMSGLKSWKNRYHLSLMYTAFACFRVRMCAGPTQWLSTMNRRKLSVGMSSWLQPSSPMPALSPRSTGGSCWTTSGCHFCAARRSQCYKHWKIFPELFYIERYIPKLKGYLCDRCENLSLPSPHSFSSLYHSHGCLFLEQKIMFRFPISFCFSHYSISSSSDAHPYDRRLRSSVDADWWCDGGPVEQWRLTRRQNVNSECDHSH